VHTDFDGKQGLTVSGQPLFVDALGNAIVGYQAFRKVCNVFSFSIGLFGSKGVKKILIVFGRN
jgi:hypothetical protein